MKTESRQDQLQRLQQMAITSNHARQARIEIAYAQEIRKGPGNFHLKVLLDDHIAKWRQRLIQCQGRIYLGQVDCGGVWGAQLAYLDINLDTGSLTFHIENMPSGWTLSQVIHKPTVCFDYGTGWTAKVPQEVWDKAQKVAQKIIQTTKEVTS